MSPDLEIIMMAASILEKSGFRLICLWCYQGGFSELGGPQANIGMGPNTFAHIYLDQPWGSFFVVMHAAAQWGPIVVSNVSTFFMYML